MIIILTSTHCLVCNLYDPFRLFTLTGFVDVRKLEKKRAALEGDPGKKGDLIEKYIDKGSQVYAPMTRFGVFIDRGSEQYNIKSAYLSSYEGNMHTIPCTDKSAILHSQRRPSQKRHFIQS